MLEGPTWELATTFETIRRDARHTKVEVIDERTIPEPSFSSWRMRYFDGRDIPRMMVQIAETAGGQVPLMVQDALIDFLGPELFRPVKLASRIVSPPEAAPPSPPRPC